MSHLKYAYLQYAKKNIVLGIFLALILMHNANAQIPNRTFSFKINENELTSRQREMSNSILNNIDFQEKIYADINAEMLEERSEINFSFNNNNISIQTNNLQKYSSDDHYISYYGHTNNNGVVDITSYRGQIRGSIKENNITYLIYPLTEKRHVILLTKGKTLSFGDGFCGNEKDDIPALRKNNTPDFAINNNASSSTQQKNAFCGNKLRVLILYTPEVTKKDKWAAIHFIDLFQKMNALNANSQINHKYELAYCGEFPFKESGNQAIDMLNFHNDKEGMVKYLREKYKADVCALVVSKLNVGGRAYRYKASYDEAYALMLYTPSTTDQYKILTHEIGHLYGCGHDDKHDWITPYNYGRAFTHFDTAPYFATVMNHVANACDEAPGCEIIPYFSNPNINYPDKKYENIHIGLKGYADNAQVMNIRASAMINMQPIITEENPWGQVTLGEYEHIRAQEVIHNKEKIGGNFYGYHVKPEGVAVFSAGNSVTLYPGFQADSGATFTAKIEKLSCTENISPTIPINEITAVTQSAVLQNNNIINVYPNPFKDIVTIKVIDNIGINNIDIKIYDVTGKLRLHPLQQKYRNSIDNHVLSFNAEALPTGMYYCIITINGKQYAEKLFK